MTSASIQAREVRKTYPGERALTALDGISLDIRPGEFVSILGPSGCGKSTFLRCIAGLEQVSSGALTVDGQAVKGPPDHVGMVFQRDSLLEWRSIARNILLPVEFAKKPVRVSFSSWWIWPSAIVVAARKPRNRGSLGSSLTASSK